VVGLVSLAAGAHAAVLRAVEATPTATGAEVRIACSARVRPKVSVIGDDRHALRVYVDLPAGTQRAAGMPAARAGAGPIAALRVGAGERGAPRVVVDLAQPVRWRLRERGRTTVIELIVPEPEPRGPTAVARAEPPAKVPAAEAPAAEDDGAAAADAPARASLSSRPRIVLDPGHGGRDPGAQGFAVEKDVTLAIARRLASLLRTRLGAEVVLTRTDDRTVTLPARTARANTEEADLFVSIHANANPRGRLQGIETYYLDNTDDQGTMRLAHMENGPAGPRPQAGKADLRYILSDLVQVGKMDESIALATAIQRGLVGTLRKRYAGIEDLGVKRGPFYVLVGAYMPCVLVETSFLTHPVEGRRLARASYREAISEGLYAGIARFLADTRRARTL
jgi:N-acetylmuramoyl-L-alanine amidase